MIEAVYPVACRARAGAASGKGEVSMVVRPAFLLGLSMLALSATSAGEEVAGTEAANAGAAAGEAIVELKDYRFVPEEITVRVGTTVRWVNREKRQFHNIWFRGLDDEGREYFFPDESRSRRFDKPGVYPYVCEPHDESHGMHGVVRVIE